MNPAAPSTFSAEEYTPGFYRRMWIYAPFVWMAARVIRLGQRAGIISPDAFRLSDTDVLPGAYHANRQLRRAEVSCLRRARRQVLKGKKIKRERYVPRAFAHLPYMDRMDKAVTPAQFREHYLRHNNISRVQLYELDHAHELTGFVPSAREAFSVMASILSGFTALNFAAPTDPAPP